MNRIVAAGNTFVPAILALEAMGFRLSIVPAEQGTRCTATRGNEEYIGDDPLEVLGLVKLIEQRGWAWRAGDAEVATTLARYALEP